MEEIKMEEIKEQEIQKKMKTISEDELEGVSGGVQFMGYCTICGESFIRPETLRKHVMNVHKE